MTRNSATAPRPNRGSLVASRKISRRVRAGGGSGSGGGSAFGGAASGRRRRRPPSGAGSAVGRRRIARPARRPPLGQRRRHRRGRRAEPPAGDAALAAGQQLRRTARDSRSGPASTTAPSASTTTSSQRRTEDSRCAMTMPIRSAQQPLGGPLHPRLGDRVHPRGGLVEDHHVRVADQDPGERDQLLLPGGEHVARPRRAWCRMPSGRSADPGGQAQLVAAPAPAGVEQVRVEQRDVLGQRAGEDLGALRHDRDPPAQRLEVEVEQVGAAEEDRAAAARRPPGSAPWPAWTCPSRSGRSARTSGRGRR